MDDPETIDLTKDLDTIGAPKAPALATSTMLIPPRTRPTTKSNPVPPSNPPASRSQADVACEWSRQNVDLLMHLRHRGTHWRTIADNFPGWTWYQCRARYKKELEITAEDRRQQRNRQQIGPTASTAEHAHVIWEASFAEARHTPPNGPPPVRHHAAIVSPYQTASTNRPLLRAPPLLTPEANMSSNAWNAGARPPLPHISTAQQLEDLDNDQFERLIYPLRSMHLSNSRTRYESLASGRQPLYPNLGANDAAGALKRKRPSEFMDSAPISPQRSLLQEAAHREVLPTQLALLAQRTGNDSDQRHVPGLTFSASSNIFQRAPIDPARSQPLATSTALQTSNVPRRRPAPWFYGGGN